MKRYYMIIIALLLFTHCVGENSPPHDKEMQPIQDESDIREDTNDLPLIVVPMHKLVFTLQALVI